MSNKRKKQIEEMIAGLLLFTLGAIFFLGVCELTAVQSIRSIVAVAGSLLAALAITIYLNVRERR